MSNFEKQGSTDADLLRLIIDLNRTPDMITIHTNLGIRFYEKNRILLFQTMSDDPLVKRTCWEVMFTDLTTKKLTCRVTSKKLVGRPSLRSFIKISQSCILNRVFLRGIDYDDRNCILVPPYDKLILPISRLEFIKIKALLLE